MWIDEEDSRCKSESFSCVSESFHGEQPATCL